MAKLRVAPDLLRELLHFEIGSVRVVGAGFDTIDDCIVLDLVGPGVPEGASEVTAIVTVARTVATLEKIR